MTEISRSALFGKLNPLAYKAIEGATVFCKLRGNPYVELVHWLQQILQTNDSDLHRIIKHFEVDAGKLAADVTAALERHWLEAFYGEAVSEELIDLDCDGRLRSAMTTR